MVKSKVIIVGDGNIGKASPPLLPPHDLDVCGRPTRVRRRPACCRDLPTASPTGMMLSTGMMPMVDQVNMPSPYARDLRLTGCAPHRAHGRRQQLQSDVGH